MPVRHFYWLRHHIFFYLKFLVFVSLAPQINKYLIQKEYITISQGGQICDGLEAKQPFSQNRAVVKNKQDYAKKLIEYMLKTTQIEKEGRRYKWHKK